MKIDNTNNVVARSIKINYNINNIDYLHIYPIDASDNQDYVTDVVILIDKYEISDFGVKLSNPFPIDKDRVFTRDALIEDLSQKISNNLGVENTLKLTK